MEAVEVWLKVTGFEDRYEVSNLARFRSLSVIVNNGVRVGKIMKPEVLKKSRYKRFKLQKNGEIKKRLLHVIVAEHFVENDDPASKKVVHHKNHDKQDNRAVNLEWATQSQNIKYWYGYRG